MKTIIEKLIPLLVVFIITTAVNKAICDDSKYSHYKIQLSIHPESQFIEVDGNLKLVVSDSIAKQLTFRIHRQFSVQRFTVNDMSDYIIDTAGGTFTPNSKELIFNLNRAVKKGDIVDVQFKYSGTITEWSKWSANVVTEDWVEIGLYFPWFPNGSGSLPATYHLNIECPSDYKVFAMGEIHKGKKAWIIEKNEPTNDLVVFVSKDLRINKTKLNNMELTICYHNMTDTMVTAFSDDLETVYNYFSKWFGTIRNQKLFLIESKREIGGGYARTGEIVLPSFRTKDYFSYRIMHIAYIGHEMAHFWWNKVDASTWQDWLNEAFAEYTALLVVREVFGQSAFEEQLQERAKNIDQTKPIWGIDRTDENAYYILYHKGAVLLNELESMIGKSAFLKLCRSYYEQDIHTTSEFLSLLKSLEGEEISNWLEESLKTR